MRTHGLEAALVHNDLVAFTGLSAADERRLTIRVAGAAALLVAKLHKINERIAASARPDRLVDKDTGDVLRLVRSTPAATMADRLDVVLRDDIAVRATTEALTALLSLFGTPAAPGVQMAVRAVAFDLDPAWSRRE